MLIHSGIHYDFSKFPSLGGDVIPLLRYVILRVVLSNSILGADIMLFDSIKIFGSSLS